jgi:hypothetical protein
MFRLKRKAGPMYGGFVSFSRDLGMRGGHHAAKMAGNGAEK